MKTITAVEAQERFGQLLDDAQHEPITITRRGRPVAVILSPRDIADLAGAHARRAGAVADFESLLAELDANLTDAGRALTEAEILRLVHESR